MKKIITCCSLSMLVAGCANTSYQQAKVASDITGFYSYTKTAVSTSVVQAIQLNSDGSGFNCSYTIGKTAASKTPIKHIGNNVWASSAFGTAEISRNEDGTVSWGPYSTYYPENIDNTSCK